jgi:hypothetical protein
MRYSASTTPEWLKNKRDKNEPEIVARIRQLGGAWFPCSRHEGHDGWVQDGELWYCCEVKNPADKWTLTTAEQKMKNKVERNHGTYWILEYPADVDKMLGA